ncbi:hypothetical protein DQM68_19520 (plasmid) [Leptospira mayottensis]|uniref:DUF1353 domain-containing protein n=1 Tax=Leptospira mayottensis 200901116 TaxID=1192864 RepID=M6UZX0_9LEPT|nr:hypothetical protein [Leptospira mayottensis]AVH81543.1 hypothetical protein [Leptospira mayottensis 200901116]AXR62860.1 hypothetical protein DQM68_19520 [Leptospira mayottensis]TGN00383.1 hypothetical protein EHR03_13230 [Leptospira mayottensis]
MKQIVYKSLKNYKYELLKPYWYQTGIESKVQIRVGHQIETFVSLDPDGLLRIEAGYAWDGPSGPTFDTKTFMRGSLVHDALYQLMRERKLDHTQHRDTADQILKKICLEDGMNSFRAAYVYRSVRWFGGSSAEPTDESKGLLLAP